MALHKPFDGRLTQAFGLPVSSVSSLEPPMWLYKNRAYWQAFPGGNWFPHVHPGIDLAADLGTKIEACEAGTVETAGWADNISGMVVEVEIRPGVAYRLNHLSRLSVSHGQKVSRGQKLGEVGITGSATGPHSHIEVHLTETGADSISRTLLWDPQLFFAGGSRSDDPLIKPIALPDTSSSAEDLPVNWKPYRRIGTIPSGVNVRRGPSANARILRPAGHKAYKWRFDGETHDAEGQIWVFSRRQRDTFKGPTGYVLKSLVKFK